MEGVLSVVVVVFMLVLSLLHSACQEGSGDGVGGGVVTTSVHTYAYREFPLYLYLVGSVRKR